MKLGRDLRERDAVGLQRPESGSDQAAEGPKKKVDPEGFDPELTERDESSFLHGIWETPSTTGQF